MTHDARDHPGAGDPTQPQVLVRDERDTIEPGAVIDVDGLERLAGFVAADQGVPEDMEIGILCVDESRMAALNAEHMGASGPTDVLAFPIDVPGTVPAGVPAVLGDIVLCPAVAVRHALAAGHDAAAELELLVVHGILHLLGHDHADDDERREMFALTDRLLADWRGIQAG